MRDFLISFDSEVGEIAPSVENYSIEGKRAAAAQNKKPITPEDISRVETFILSRETGRGLKTSIKDLHAAYKEFCFEVGIEGCLNAVLFRKVLSALSVESRISNHGLLFVWGISPDRRELGKFPAPQKRSSNKEQPEVRIREHPKKKMAEKLIQSVYRRG